MTPANRILVYAYDRKNEIYTTLRQIYLEIIDYVDSNLPLKPRGDGFVLDGENIGISGILFEFAPTEGIGWDKKYYKDDLFNARFYLQSFNGKNVISLYVIDKNKEIRGENKLDQIKNHLRENESWKAWLHEATHYYDTMFISNHAIKNMIEKYKNAPGLTYRNQPMEFNAFCVEMEDSLRGMLYDYANGEFVDVNELGSNFQNWLKSKGKYSIPELKEFLTNRNYQKLIKRLADLYSNTKIALQHRLSTQQKSVFLQQKYKKQFTRKKDLLQGK